MDDNFKINCNVQTFHDILTQSRLEYINDKLNFEELTIGELHYNNSSTLLSSCVRYINTKNIGNLILNILGNIENDIPNTLKNKISKLTIPLTDFLQTGKKLMTLLNIKDIIFSKFYGAFFTFSTLKKTKMENVLKIIKSKRNSTRKFCFVHHGITKGILENLEIFGQWIDESMRN